MPDYRIAFHLGRWYEAARASGNLTRCIALERRIGRLQERSGHNLVILVVRGRNEIRRQLGLEEVNV